MGDIKGFALFAIHFVSGPSRTSGEGSHREVCAYDFRPRFGLKAKSLSAHRGGVLRALESCSGC